MGEQRPLAPHILELLPDDGSPVLNRVMRTMIAQRLERRIEADLYFKEVDQLVVEGRIGRARGRGGSIFLAGEIAEPVRPLDEEWSEARLMQPLQDYLRGLFLRLLDLPPGSTTVVADTSTIGPRFGQWARPDFILVTVMKFQLVPGRQVDVHSFELKTENGGTVQAVHEALAQTRFTNFGHLVWHLPEGSKAAARLPDVERQCEMHGIGLILIRDPAEHATWQVRLDPEVKPTPPATIDAFLMSRLGSRQRDTLKDAVFGS